MKTFGRLWAVIVITILLVGYAEAAESGWMKTYGGDTDTFCGDILALEDGGYVVVGTTNMQFEPERRGDIYLLRTDADGEILWENTYPSETYTSAQGITQTADGNLLIAGATISAAGDQDGFLLKVDQDGNEIWSRTYGGPLDEMLGGVVQLESGDFVAAGLITDPNDIVAYPGTAGYTGLAGRSNVYLTKIDAEGNELWSQQYGGDANVLLAGAVQAPDGHMFILANILHFPVEDNDMLLLRLDADGNEVWSQLWDADNMVGQDMISLVDGSYLIAAAYTDSDNATANQLFINIDSEGNTNWQSRVGAPDMIDFGSVITQAPGGGYAAAWERAANLNTWDVEMVFVVLDEQGQLVQETTMPSQHTIFASILPQSENGYIIAGSTFVNNAFKIFLLKTTAEGI